MEIIGGRLYHVDIRCHYTECTELLTCRVGLFINCSFGDVSSPENVASKDDCENDLDWM